MHTALLRMNSSGSNSEALAALEICRTLWMGLNMSVVLSSPLTLADGARQRADRDQLKDACHPRHHHP